MCTGSSIKGQPRRTGTRESPAMGIFTTKIVSYFGWEEIKLIKL